MPQVARSEESENARIVLGLLESVERDGAQSQRKLASDLGIALGLVNAYLKRCVKKGLLKIGQAPARRYAYYLTPHGFAEKSRLTVEYLSSSFSFFRRAREDCSSALEAAHARGWNRIALIGVSDLAEIATICALEQSITIVAVVDA
jgi:DNA-binding MarR family transcriptional regulator